MGSAVAAGSISGSSQIAAQIIRSGDAPEKMIFAQGALAGGGYVKDIDISPDGTTRVVSTDVASGWVWDAALSKWQNVLSFSRVPPAYRRWGSSRNCWAIRCAPSLPARVYMVSLAGGSNPSPVWRSDDRCKSWIDTGYKIAADVEQSRGIGPLIAVDPANPDIVYIADAVGAIHRSFDGGKGWAVLNGLARELISAQTVAPTPKGGTELHFGSVPSAVANHGKYAIYPRDLTNPGAIAGAFSVVGATPNSVKLSGGLQGAVAAGDTIVFGGFASIVFDPKSGTTNGRTKGIYIGFGYGASGVYSSIDAGETFSRMLGSPALVVRLHCSNDGVLYATDYSGWGGGGGGKGTGNPNNAWKCESGRWTNLNISGAPGNTYHGVASDPNNPGTVVFVTMAGNICMSTNYGASFSPNGSANPRVATDAPWLATTEESWQSNGAIAFDPVVRGRLWIVEGIGIWYCTPTVAKPTSTLTSQTADNNELILTSLKKPPGGPLLTTCWDRVGFVLPGPTIYPTHDLTKLPRGFGHGWDIDFANSDPSFYAIIVGSTIHTTADAGKTWTKPAQPKGANWGGAIAVQTPKNFVFFPSNNGVPSYTLDGGSTWAPCLFNGTPMPYGWSFAYYLNRHVLCADLVNRATYYAVSYAYETGMSSVLVVSGGRGYRVGDTVTFPGRKNPGMSAVVEVTSVSGSAISGVSLRGPGLYDKPLPNSFSQASTSGGGSGATFNALWRALGGTWRSTDGGANWRQMTTKSPNERNANQNSILVPVPGHEGHLFFGCGGQNRYPLARSVDAGATWHEVNGPYGKCVGYQVACGKPAPGKTYPAIYMAGNLPGNSILDKPVALYRSDDCTGDPRVKPTWKLLSYAPCDLLDAPNCLCADSEEYGTIYIAFGATGYGYGKLAS
jgi:photosystem II stability/assembly factor-like uncharacterized protein